MNTREKCIEGESSCKTGDNMDNLSFKIGVTSLYKFNVRIAYKS